MLSKLHPQVDQLLQQVPAIPEQQLARWMTEVAGTIKPIRERRLVLGIEAIDGSIAHAIHEAGLELQAKQQDQRRYSAGPTVRHGRD